ncbi:MAG: hypothetical protein IT284_01120 [Bacteroidetes bacterium]|nr:hypothetical protein [Bacteroidota bacterium]
MKKYLTRSLIFRLAVLGIIVFLFYYFPLKPAIFFSAIFTVFSFFAIRGIQGAEYTQETFKNPLQLSISSAGHNYSVEEVVGDKIGLIRYGPDKDPQYLIKTGYLTWYRACDFPPEARNTGIVISVSENAYKLAVTVRLDVPNHTLINADDG